MKMSKSSFSIMFFCICAMMLLKSSAAFAGLDDHLLLYYSFDTSNATDVSSSGNDGSVYGATWTDDSPTDGAYEFDGVNDFISIDGSALSIVSGEVSVVSSTTLDPQGGELTMMALVRPASFEGGYGDCPIISKWDDYETSTNRSWRLAIDGSLDSYIGTIFASWSADGVHSRTIRSSKTAELKEWQHIAVVINRGSSSIFVNGTWISESSQGTYYSFQSSNSLPAYVGSAEEEIGRSYFHGAIDEVRVYDKALSTEEIERLAEEAGVTVQPRPDDTSSSTTTTTTLPPLYWGPGDGKAYNDFDGDAVSDLCVFDKDDGSWFVYSLANGVLVWDIQWGWAGAKPVPADYDGDGVWDLGAYDEFSGTWYIYSLANGVLAWGTPWGWYGATVVTGDYNGDGKADMAVFDNTTGDWYITSVDGSVLAWAVPWGWAGTEPVSGDYDGDGADDLAIYDSESGYWCVHSLAQDSQIAITQWGWNQTLEPVPGDYNGDLTNDLALFDSSDGTWNIYSQTGHRIVDGALWGWSGATPVAGDYDGDGWDDMAVFDSGTGSWCILSMNGNLLAWGLQWGWPGSEPVATDDDNKFRAAVDADISGSWTYLVTSGGSGGGTLDIAQAGSVLSGTLSSTSGETGVITGEVDGDEMDITVVYTNGDVIYLSASITEGSMSGTWLASSGSMGYWSATQ